MHSKSWRRCRLVFCEHDTLRSAPQKDCLSAPCAVELHSWRLVVVEEAASPVHSLHDSAHVTGAGAAQGAETAGQAAGPAAASTSGARLGSSSQIQLMAAQRLGCQLAEAVPLAAEVCLGTHDALPLESRADSFSSDGGSWGLDKAPSGSPSSAASDLGPSLVQWQGTAKSGGPLTTIQENRHLAANESGAAVRITATGAAVATATSLRQQGDGQQLNPALLSSAGSVASWGDEAALSPSQTPRDLSPRDEAGRQDPTASNPLAKAVTSARPGTSGSALHSHQDLAVTAADLLQGLRIGGGSEPAASTKLGPRMSTASGLTALGSGLGGDLVPFQASSDSAVPQQMTEALAQHLAAAAGAMAGADAEQSSMAGSASQASLPSTATAPQLRFMDVSRIAPNRVCCNALLAAYARAKPPQWRKVSPVPSAVQYASLAFPAGTGRPVPSAIRAAAKLCWRPARARSLCGGPRQASGLFCKRVCCNWACCRALLAVIAQAKPPQGRQWNSICCSHSYCNICCRHRNACLSMAGCRFDFLWLQVLSLLQAVAPSRPLPLELLVSACRHCQPSNVA